MSARLAQCAVLAIALTCGAPDGIAQTSGTPVQAPRALLPADKQALVKEYVQKAKVPVSDIGVAVTVGTAIPSNADLFALPEDTMCRSSRATSFCTLQTPSR